MITNIVFEPIFHNKTERIAIRCSYDKINKIIRTIPGAKWSQGNKCFAEVRVLKNQLRFNPRFAEVRVLTNLILFDLAVDGVVTVNFRFGKSSVNFRMFK